MENPLTWGPVEKKIYEAKKAWDESQAQGIVGYSYPAYIAIELRKAELLNETSVDELLETDPEVVVEKAMRDAIAKLSAECSFKQLEIFNNLYPRLRKDNLDSAYKLLVRTVLKNRAQDSVDSSKSSAVPEPFGA
jgi:hypothetical protein